ncbi:hypothetical protein [Pseudomonas sp. BF-B-25]|uniref:hypothetical protein n=1 Tax=Pseudomonas sp. BF-B-25 TaxID=2832355 RepID=UPI001CBF1ABD|nr:hypothetical protein [Pseudomonas sp. BF-B-25]
MLRDYFFSLKKEYFCCFGFLSLLFSNGTCHASGGVPIATFTPPQYEISIQNSGRSVVTIGIPLATLEENSKIAIKEGVRGKPLNPRLMSLNFRQFSSGSKNIELYVDLDTDVARCEVWARISIPASDLQHLIVQDIGSDSDCRSGLPPELGLPTLLRNAVLDGVRSALGKSLLDKSNIDDWIKEDPLWAGFITKAIVQGSYCVTRVGQGICLRAAWVAKDALDLWIDRLLSLAPSSSGAADNALALLKLTEFRNFAIQKNMKQSARIIGYSYPAEVHADGTFGDGDMAIFAGLLCLSGEPEGCGLLFNSKGANGRFWRSPDKVGNIKKDESSFSGDQFNGVAAFLWLSNDSGIFSDYIRYILNTRQQIPSVANSFYNAYKSCTDDNAYQCVLAGPEWTWLVALAAKYGMAGQLPSDESSPERYFGFGYDAMLWQAALAPAGYRLHLTGVQVLLARTMGASDPKLDKIAAILAGRQPQNPFFLYLHLGADRQVENQLNSQCSTTRAQARRDDWAWQRATSQEAWNNSMLWDCVFMYRLLSGKKDLWVPPAS